MSTTARTQADPGYGARIVSVDTLRRCRLAETRPDEQTTVALTVGRPTPTHIPDRLALAHWPRGHQILVGSLAGGVGRTTVSGLLGTVLAELPFAHIWPPVALHETGYQPPRRGPHRWDLVDDDGDLVTRAGAWVFADGAAPARRDDFSVIIEDHTPGLPSHETGDGLDPGTSMLLVVRPDRTSLAEASDALVRLHDEQLLDRHQVVVVINHGTGQSDRGSRAAGTALWTRCAAVHNMPRHRTLSPGRCLPSGRDLPKHIRRVMQQVACDLWTTTQFSPPAKTND